jgi:ring-1,2-phenylacetyl-CoA epoxidase subunit PaaD
VSTLAERAWQAASQVVDPELPVLTIADLGVLRGVDEVAEGVVEVRITPTYSGCPAMGVIAVEVELALARAGIPGLVRTVLSPAWTTDWMTEAARAKLRDYGIAPPGPARGTRGALFGRDELACPRCASSDTELLSEFGSTSCKALWRCRACREPFDHFKCH